MTTVTNVYELAQRLQANGQFTHDELEHWINVSEPSNSAFISCNDAKNSVAWLSKFFVETYFNNPDANVVPLRLKTRVLLVLNNLAMERKFRSLILEGLATMTSIFEESMKKEGTMPFDSELGRMSEHVLVLLMRVLNYKMKAVQVHEFAEFNTQFAIQLLLAILLKEPPYELELRCNCISGLLGFTQPQGFFNPSAAIQLQDCSVFSEKVDFICNLMLRLSAIQVVNDVLTPHLIELPTISPMVHCAVVNMMRCIMNIFQFVSTGAALWREQLLTTTPFVDGVSILYIQGQTRALQSLLLASGMQAPTVPPEVLGGLGLAIKFMAFATFHMGRTAKNLRSICPFIHDLLNMQTRALLGSQHAGNAANVYTQLFHFLCNIDALAGDDGLDDEDLMPELSSASLRQTLTSFLANQVAPNGAEVFDHCHTKFYSVDTDALVSQDCVTFQAIDSAFYEVKQRFQQQQAAAPAQPQQQNTLLGNVPAPTNRKDNKVALSQAAEVPKVHNFVISERKQQEAASSGGSKYTCALNGHTLKVPVTSPYGHVFEKDTIEQWIRQQGSVCPLTGKPLSLQDLQINRDLQNEIMQVVVQQSMSSYNQENDVDLYDF